jgi:hypothetical protein
MGWDSNPRIACTIAGFQVRCIQPLCHPSSCHVISLANCVTKVRFSSAVIVSQPLATRVAVHDNRVDLQDMLRKATAGSARSYRALCMVNSLVDMHL